MSIQEIPKALVPEATLIVIKEANMVWLHGAHIIVKGNRINLTRV
jgi:hypothetical protein